MRRAAGRHCNRPPRRRLPSGPPYPYTVFGLDPAVPTSRDPAVLESYYRRASHLLNRSQYGDPCSPAFAKAARLVADAWACLSDPDLKASLDSSIVPAATAAAPAPTAPSLEPPPLQPALPPPPQQSPPLPAQAGSDGMGRVKRSRKRRVPSPPPPPAQAGPDGMGRGKRVRKRRKMMNL